MNAISVNRTAADAIRSKAGRLLAAAVGKPGEHEASRQAAAMNCIATHVEAGLEALQAALAPGAAGAAGFTDTDRKRAAEEVYSLALRREGQGLQRQIDAPIKPGWEVGGTELPIHRATLREAADLFDLALAIEYESFRDYSRGFVLEALGDFDTAARVFDGVTGSHAQYGGTQAARCRSKSAGTWDADAEREKAFAAISARMKGGGAGSWLGGMAIKLVSSALGRFGGRESRPDRAAPPVRDDDPAALDRASHVAQVFAEHLVAGNFEAAQALLARPLRHLTAADLRESYTAMTDYGDEGVDTAGDDAPSVLVMTCDADMPDLAPDDIGWVYVAISGGMFNEAVTVVVTDEQGEGRIRELEWGRP